MDKGSDLEEAEEKKKYRDLLIEARQRAERSYDKTLLSLSAGALGISFAFVTDIVPADKIAHHVLLMSAWMCWGLSMVSVLLSFVTSRKAFTRAILEVDEGEGGRLGGRWDKATTTLNLVSGSAFIVGVCILIAFVWCNLGR